MPGQIHQFALTANITLTDALNSGQSITCEFTNTDSYTVAWPTITWLGNAWDAAIAGPYVVELVKIGSTLYGNALGGEVS